MNLLRYAINLPIIVLESPQSVLFHSATKLRMLRKACLPNCNDTKKSKQNQNDRGSIPACFADAILA